MATYKGIPKKFRMEWVDPANTWDLSWGDIEFKWEYNTTCRILELFETDPYGNVDSVLFGKENAQAVMMTLVDWYQVEYGKQSLESIIKDILDHK